ncbi:MAG: DUF1731 domain-containing protein, partial [Flavobacteriales bacterium]|nr:DUF1731 domain-containing protein [Flavobacteriales bacterium]
SCPVGGTRQVALRLGMVLGKEGGAWPTLRRLAMLGGGGRNGSGNQMVSWIHLTDVCRIIQFVATHDELEGPVNAVSPYPLKNKEFMAKMRRYTGAVPGIPQPEWLVKAGAWITGTDASLALRGNNVYPSKLLEAGFQFTYALADDAMAELSGRKTVV